MSSYYLAFDTETGGLDPKTADVLTFYGAIVDENFRVLDEVDLKLKPDGGRLPMAQAQALSVNKIDLQAHLADPETITYSDGKKLILTLLAKFHKKAGRYNNIRPLGHNVPFDQDMVWHHLIPKIEWQSYCHYHSVDTVPIVNFLKDVGFMPKDVGNLASIVEFLQLPKRKAHTAKDDTLMVVDSYKKLIEIMKSKKDGGSTQDLIALLESE